MSQTNKNKDFCYRVRSRFQVSNEYLLSEREFLRNSMGKRPIERLLKLFLDNNTRKGALIQYLVKRGMFFLMKRQLRKALLILFELDSRTDEEFQQIETMYEPRTYLDSIINQPEIYQHVFEGML